MGEFDEDELSKELWELCELEAELSEIKGAVLDLLLLFRKTADRLDDDAFIVQVNEFEKTALDLERGRLRDPVECRN